MAQFPGFQLPGVGQIGGVAPVGAPAQPAITGITVGTTAPTAQVRMLTQEAIGRHIANAQKAGPLVYWQVARPARQLKLTGAITYVNRNFAAQPPDNRFVYWERYRVAGLVSDIVNAFRQAGVNVTPEMVRSEALDPLNPEHRARIEGVTAAAPAVEKPKAKHTFEEYIQIGQALKASAKAQAGVPTVKGVPTARGGRSPEANRARLVAELTQAMQTVLAGMEVPRVFDVTKFDPTKFSGARKVAPPKSARATAIRPMINVQGRMVALPIIAQPAGAGNFRAFIQTVLAATPYAQYGDDAIAAFNARLQPITMAPQFAQFMPKIAPAAPMAPQYPEAGPFPTYGGVPSVMEQLGGVRSGSVSPRSGAVSPAGAAFQLPQVGGAGLPTVGGVALPTVGGAALPAVGGVSLPRVGM